MGLGWGGKKDFSLRKPFQSAGCFLGCPGGMPHVSASVCLYSSRNRTAKGYCIFAHTLTHLWTNKPHTHRLTHPLTHRQAGQDSSLEELRSCQFAFLNLRIAKSILSVTTNIYPAQGFGPAVSSPPASQPSSQPASQPDGCVAVALDVLSCAVLFPSPSPPGATCNFCPTAGNFENLSDHHFQSLPQKNLFFHHHTSQL